MQSNQDKDRIENLKKSLDSRKAPIIQDIQPNLQKHEYSVQGDWGDHEEMTAEDQSGSGTNPLIKKLLIFSVLFFVVALGVASYIFFQGVNVISANNIDIQVAGPISIGGGQELDLDITIKNQNSTSLQSTSLTVQYPDGTRNPDNIAKALPNTTEDLGPIPAGESLTKKVRSVLYGTTNSQKRVTILVNYKMNGSNAVFQKDKTFDVILSSSPITMTVSSLSEVNSGQPLELLVNLTSNSSEVIKNTMLTAEYPFGFTYSDSTVKPYSGNNVWLLGDMLPGQRMTVKVHGRLDAQDGEQRTFKFSTGIQGTSDQLALSPAFESAQQVVTINKPFIGVNLALNGDTSDTYVGKVGEPIRGDISWINNLPSKVTDASLSIKLSGTALDKNSVQSEGFYRSSDNMIVWDKNTNSELTVLNPGDSGSMSFTFGSIIPDSSMISKFKNQNINLELSVKGKRVEDANVPEDVFSTIKKTVQFRSELAVAAQVGYQNGPFVNSGPLPPRAEKPTTYTVIWAVTNTFNDARAVQVSAILPQYVTWLNTLSPSTEDVSYDSASNKITWNVGEVPAGTGFTNSLRQVAFQVSFTPSVSQVGSAPVLVNGMTLTGIDRFTNQSLSAYHEPLTTTLTNDRSFRYGDDLVAQ